MNKRQENFRDCEVGDFVRGSPPSRSWPGIIEVEVGGMAPLPTLTPKMSEKGILEIMDQRRKGLKTGRFLKQEFLYFDSTAVFWQRIS